MNRDIGTAATQRICWVRRSPLNPSSTNFWSWESRQRQSDIKYQEFTYTAPKGFSVAAAVDPRLKAELLSAVKDEFTWFEGFARVRDRRGTLVSTETTRATGNLRVALFAHETSRTNDPNFHVHGLVANVTYDAERKADFALHYGELMRMRKTLDARIHNNLGPTLFGATATRSRSRPTGSRSGKFRGKRRSCSAPARGR